MKDKIKNILFKLSVFGLLFIVPIVNSCEPQQSQSKNVNSMIESLPSDDPQITNVQLIHTHIKSKCIYFIRFKFNEHYYIKSGSNVLFHAPDCDCYDKKDGLVNSPLFEW